MSVQTINPAIGRIGWTGLNTKLEVNRNLVKLAHFLDEAIRIPGTSKRIGADGIIGLIPGIGDAATAVVGLLMLQEARRLGLPMKHQAKIVANYVIDVAIGVVPGLGDLFDFAFKAHSRSLALLQQHVAEQNAAA